MYPLLGPRSRQGSEGDDHGEGKYARGMVLVMSVRCAPTESSYLRLGMRRKAGRKEGTTQAESEGEGGKGTARPTYATPARPDLRLSTTYRKQNPRGPGRCNPDTPIPLDRPEAS